MVDYLVACIDNIPLTVRYNVLSVKRIMLLSIKLVMRKKRSFIPEFREFSAAGCFEIPRE